MQLGLGCHSDAGAPEDTSEQLEKDIASGPVVHQAVQQREVGVLSACSHKLQTELNKETILAIRFAEGTKDNQVHPVGLKVGPESLG